MEKCHVCKKIPTDGDVSTFKIGHSHYFAVICLCKKNRGTVARNKEDAIAKWDAWNKHLNNTETISE